LISCGAMAKRGSLLGAYKQYQDEAEGPASEQEAGTDAAQQQLAPAEESQSSGSWSWKAWSQRTSGNDVYSFGDFSQGVLERALPQFKSVKEYADDLSNNLSRSIEDNTKSVVSKLITTHVLPDEAEKDAGEDQPHPRRKSANDKWREALKKLYDAEPQGGCVDSDDGEGEAMVEVRIMAIAGAKVESATSEDEPALHPVAMLAVGSRSTGYVEAGGEVRIRVRDVIHEDLRIFLFDKGTTAWKTGYIENSCCGGAVLPLTHILQAAGSASLLQRMRQTYFNMEVITLRLCPIHHPADSFADEVQLEGKLIPAVATTTGTAINGLPSMNSALPSGGLHVEQDHGTVMLQVKLEIKRPLAVLYLSDEKWLSEQQPPKRQGAACSMDDFLQTMRPFVESVSRIKACLPSDYPLAGVLLFQRMRNQKVAVVLWVLWTFICFYCPFWLMPLVFALVWVFFALLASQVESLAHPVKLYREEVQTVESSALGKGKAYVGEMLIYELQLREVSQVLQSWAVILERLRGSMAFEDPLVSLESIGVFMMAAILLSAFLFVVTCLQSWHSMMVWLAGAAWLLPDSWRGKLLAAYASYEKASATDKQREHVLGALWAFWSRLPTTPVMEHRQLAKNYCICKNGHLVGRSSK